MHLLMEWDDLLETQTFSLCLIINEFSIIWFRKEYEYTKNLKSPLKSLNNFFYDSNCILNVMGQNNSLLLLLKNWEWVIIMFEILGFG